MVRVETLNSWMIEWAQKDKQMVQDFVSGNVEELLPLTSNNAPV